MHVARCVLGSGAIGVVCGILRCGGRHSATGLGIDDLRTGGPGGGLRGAAILRGARRESALSISVGCFLATFADPYRLSRLEKSEKREEHAYDHERHRVRMRVGSGRNLTKRRRIAGPVAMNIAGDGYAQACVGEEPEDDYSRDPAQILAPRNV